MTIKGIGKICKQSENVYEIVRYLFAFLFVLRCEYIFAGKLIYAQKRTNFLKFEIKQGNIVC